MKTRMHRTYYVHTGEISEIVVAPSARDAVKGAMIRSFEKEQAPGLLISCNTIGFGEHPDEDLMFITENELKALGYSVKAFLLGFNLSNEQWRAYRQIKVAVETFQSLLTDSDLL